MNKNNFDVDKLEKKYGKWFRWSRPYDYFFNEEKDEVTIYNRFEKTEETYKTNEIKEKINGIMEKKGLEAAKEPSTKNISKAVKEGMDMRKAEEILKMDGVGLIIWFHLSGAAYEIESKLDKEEKKIFKAIPPGKQKEFLDLTKGKTYKNFISALENSELRVSTQAGSE